MQIITTISHNIYFFGLQDAIVRSSRYVVVWTTKKQSKKKFQFKKFSWKKLLYFIVYGGKYAFLCMYLDSKFFKREIWNIYVLVESFYDIRFSFINTYALHIYYICSLISLTHCFYAPRSTSQQLSFVTNWNPEA